MHKGGTYTSQAPSYNKIAIDDIEGFLSSATQPWGNQGLTNVGRALQKHSGRVGSPFEKVKFSHKTANQEGLNILNNIMNSKSQIIRYAPQGGYEIFDSVTKQGFGVSRNGLFNGFRNLK